MGSHEESGGGGSLAAVSEGGYGGGGVHFQRKSPEIPLPSEQELLYPAAYDALPQYGGGSGTGRSGRGSVNSTVGRRSSSSSVNDSRRGGGRMNGRVRGRQQ
ncbi:unnamed protein product, partial [Pylaiella littoralis]